MSITVVDECPGAGPVRTLSAEEIEAIKATITPVAEIPLYRSTRTLFPLPRAADGWRMSVTRC